MKYILLMYVPGERGDYLSSGWSKEHLDARMEYWYRLNKALRDSGELVAVETLAAPGLAKVVRAGKDISPTVTDGPFAESKEFLAGYWIVDVAAVDGAYAIAARAGWGLSSRPTSPFALSSVPRTRFRAGGWLEGTRRSSLGRMWCGFRRRSATTLSSRSRQARSGRSWNSLRGSKAA